MDISLSQKEMDEIINEYLKKLPEEERSNAYEDILYLFNKKIKNTISKNNYECSIIEDTDENVGREANQDQEILSKSTTIESYKNILKKLINRFIEFRLLAITPQQTIPDSELSDYYRNKRKTIKNFSFTGNIQKIPKTESQRKMFGKIFESSIFSVLTSRQRAKFIDCLKPKETDIDEIIIRKGEDGDKLFFLEKGRFGLILEEHEYDESRNNKRHGRYPVQTVIFENRPMIELTLPLHMVTGEIALLHGIPRTATIVSRERGVIWYLKRNSYNTIRLFDEEQKWRTFIEKMEKVGWTKGELASQAQIHVFESGRNVRLIECVNCRNFIQDCCPYFEKAAFSRKSPTHIFFSSFSAEIEIDGQFKHVKTADILESNFYTVSEIEGYTLPRKK